MTTHSTQFEDMKEPTKLSERDEQLVGLIAVGLTDAEISTRLQIPEPEVASHIISKNPLWISAMIGKEAATPAADILIVTARIFGLSYPKAAYPLPFIDYLN